MVHLFYACVLVFCMQTTGTSRKVPAQQPGSDIFVFDRPGGRVHRGHSTAA